MPRGQVKRMWDAQLFRLGMSRDASTYRTDVILVITSEDKRGKGRYIKLSMTPEDAEKLADDIKLKVLHTKQYRGDFDGKRN